MVTSRRLLNSLIIVAVGLVGACGDHPSEPGGPDDALTAAEDGPPAPSASSVAADPFVQPAPPVANAGPRKARAATSEDGQEFDVRPPGGGMIVVDDDGAECPNPDFSTIQAAVDDAATTPSPDRIRICPGTYAENVLIGPGNSLTLVGDGAGSAVVTGVAGTAGPIIDVDDAGRVFIRDLTVDGGSALAGGVVRGIRYIDTDGNLEDVEVLNIRNGSGSSQGIGVGVRTSDETRTARVHVRGAVLDNYTRVGILGDGVGVRLVVSDNSITGPVDPRVWAPNGVQVSRGAVGLVLQNFIDNNPSPNPPGGGGSGVILLCAGPTHVHHNQVTRADLGVSIADNAGAHVHHNEITDSGFDAISLQFIGLIFGDLGCPAADNPTESNFVHNNQGVASAGNGLSLVNFDPATSAATPNDNRVLANRFEDNDTGIAVFAGFFDGDNPSGNTFLNNRIENSVTLDALDGSTGSGTAGTANRWLNNRCDTDDPDGLCRNGGGPPVLP